MMMDMLNVQIAESGWLGNIEKLGNDCDDSNQTCPTETDLCDGIDNDGDRYPKEVASGCFTEEAEDFNFQLLADYEGHGIDCNDTDPSIHPYSNQSNPMMNKNCDNMTSSSYQGYLLSGNSIKTGLPSPGDVYYLSCKLHL